MAFIQPLAPPAPRIMGIDYGLIGLICFFGMFIYTFYLMVRAYLTTDSREGEMALPVACVIAVLFFVRLVLSQLDNVPLIFIVFGVAIALSAQTNPLRQRKAAAGKPDLGTQLQAPTIDDERLQPAE